MNRKVLFAIGVAGSLLCNFQTDARAEVLLSMGDRGSGVSIQIGNRPDFMYLDDYGFSVSYGGPYDIIYYGDDYYMYRNGGWLRSRDYRGPWGNVRSMDLPPAIRNRRWSDIDSRRNQEFRRHDRGYWDQQFGRDREQWRSRENQRGPGDGRDRERR